MRGCDTCWGVVEVVFWLLGGGAARVPAQRRGYRPAFPGKPQLYRAGLVFVIMVIAASRPINDLAGALLHAISRALPLERPVAYYSCCFGSGRCWVRSLPSPRQ
jgi:hypothetical protein